MSQERTYAESFAESFRLRPGMFLGRVDDPTQILVSLIEMAVSAEPARLDLVIKGDGAIVVRAEGTLTLAQVRADWDATHKGPETERASRSFGALLAEAASTRFRIDWDASSLEVEALPDPERFGVRRLTFFPVAGYLRDAATARASLRVSVHDELTDARLSFGYARGAVDRLMEENGLGWLNHAPLRFVGDVEGIAFDVALAWRNGPGLQLVALVNGERTANGGSHVKGVWEGVARAIEAKLVERGDGRRRVMC